MRGARREFAGETEVNCNEKIVLLAVVAYRFWRCDRRRGTGWV